MKTSYFFVFLALIFSVGAAVPTQAQVQTTKQCVATSQARASLSLTKAEILNLCENNSDEVVACVLTMMQGNRFSSNLSQSVKDCRKQFIFNYY